MPVLLRKNGQEESRLLNLRRLGSSRQMNQLFLCLVNSLALVSFGFAFFSGSCALWTKVDTEDNLQNTPVQAKVREGVLRPCQLESATTLSGKDSVGIDWRTSFKTSLPPWVI